MWSDSTVFHNSLKGNDGWVRIYILLLYKYSGLKCIQYSLEYWLFSKLHAILKQSEYVLYYNEQYIYKYRFLLGI